MIEKKTPFKHSHTEASSKSETSSNTANRSKTVKRSSYLKNRWFFRLVLSFLATSLVLTVILMLIVSRQVTGQFVDHIDASNHEILAQTVVNIDYTLTDLYTEYYHLWENDPMIQAALTAQDSAEQAPLDQALTDELRFSVGQLMLVRSVHFISYRLDRVWSSNAEPTSIDQLPDLGANAFLEEIAAKPDTYRQDIFFARKTQFSPIAAGIEPTDSNSLTFFFAKKAAAAENSPFDDVLLVNINRDAFDQLIQKQRKDGFILLVSPSGEIVSDTNKQWMGQSLTDVLSSPEQISRILSDTETNGSFLANTKIGRSLITWQKASSMNVYLIDMTPLEKVYAEVNSLNRRIVIYFLAAMLISLLIGLFSVRRLYKPLQKILDRIGPVIQTQPDLSENSLNGQISQPQPDEFDLLDAAYQHFAIREQQQTLAQLLHGIPPETSLAQKKTFQTTTNPYADPSAAGWYALAVMPVQEKSLTLEQLSQLSLQIQEKLGLVNVVSGDETLSALIPLRDQKTDRSRRAQLTLFLQNWKLDGLPDLVCGIGTPVENPTDARITHRQAIVAANQARLILSDQQTDQPPILDYAEISLGRRPDEAVQISPASQAKTMILEKLSDSNLTIDQIAADIGLSTGYLRQLFKQETGQTLNDFLIESRIQRACELLENTDQTAREIALATGFNDPRYFYTLFKKRTGLTTDQYRRQHP